ncbi:MAG TPA: squalene/phytoene synthase family protein [Ignavibacteria bacterium]
MDININKIYKENYKSNFYYSFAFLPKNKRTAINKFYSFCQISDEIADCDLEQDIKKKNLQEWKNELKLAFESKSNIFILNEIKDIAEQFSIPKSLFFELLEGMEMDLNNKTYNTFKDLECYCYKVASVVGLIIIKIVGYKNKTAEDYAINLGKALQLTNILRDVKNDYKMGRIYFPLDDLHNFNVKKEFFKDEILTKELFNLFQSYYYKAISYYNAADSLLDKEDKRRFLVPTIMRNIYYSILVKIKDNNFDVFNYNYKLSKFQKIYIILKTIIKNIFT